MDFQFSEKSLKLQKELSDFMLEYVNDQEKSILNFQKNYVSRIVFPQYKQIINDLGMKSRLESFSRSF